MKKQEQYQSPQLVVALDVPDAKKAIEAANSFVGLNLWMKIGLELFTAEGPSVVKAITSLGFPVFLDLKFHDIPNTVSGAVTSAVKAGASLLSLHISGGKEMMKAAVAARNTASQSLGLTILPKLLGITVLTSTPPKYGETMEDIVASKALDAKECGLDGIVCSGLEVSMVKKTCEENFLCLCPGIRLSGGQANDQARVCTPEQAVKNGADYLVMGRPIMDANDPFAVAKKVYDLITIA